MKFYLIVAKGKKLGLPIPITVDLFLLGSDKVCQLRSKKAGIGAQHCALVTRDRKVFIRDLNSGHPTLLNSSLVPPGAEWPLHAGDRLEFGPLAFTLQIREKPLSERDPEEWALRCLDHSSDREFEEPVESTVAPASSRADTPAQAAASIIDKLQARRGTILGRLRISREEGVTVVRFNDRYLVEQAEIALVKKELHDILAHNNLRVLLDCKNVRRMSTVAVAMIDEVHGWLRGWGSKLALCRVRPEVQDILPQLSLRAPILHYPDKQAAFTSKW